jgi:WS/DGAT/MGAT family acyltransferase
VRGQVLATVRRANASNLRRTIAGVSPMQPWASGGSSSKGRTALVVQRLSAHDAVEEATVAERTYLSQNDTIMWMVEADPLLRSTIVGVVVLESAPDWSRLQARMQEVTHHVAALRDKVVPVPLHPTTLRWVADTDFDLAYHLRRVRLPDGSGADELFDFARTAAMSGFDAARPLWEFTLVEGVQHDGAERAALVMKAHHVVSDGIGAVQLAAHLFDFEPEPSEREPTEPPVIRHHSQGDLLRDVVLHDLDGVVDFVLQHAGSVVPNLLHAVRHPRQAVGAAIATAGSIGRLVAPAMQPKSPVMVGRMLASNFRVLEVPVDGLRDTAKRAGGSINDAFLAGVTSGLRIYHEQHGRDIDELRVAMPISQRTATDAAGGNHVSVMRFVVPIAQAPVGERIRDLHAIVDAVRHERSLDHTETVAGFLNLMPKGVIGAMLKGVDFLASNVPGVPVPMWLAGRQVRQFFPFGPTAGAALNVTLMSYAGQCCIGVNADAAAIPDPDVLLRCLRAGFDGVVRTA